MVGFTKALPALAAQNIHQCCKRYVMKTCPSYAVNLCQQRKVAQIITLKGCVKRYTSMVVVDSQHQHWSRSCGGGLTMRCCALMQVRTSDLELVTTSSALKWELANFRASGPILRPGNRGHLPSTTNGCEIDGDVTVT